MNIQFSNYLEQAKKQCPTDEELQTALLDQAVYRVNIAKDELEQAQEFLSNTMQYINR